MGVSVYGSQIRIKKATNGWVVCYEDPKIREANRKPNARYQEAEKEVIFTDMKKMVAFLQKALPKLMPITDEEEFEDEFTTRAG